MSEQQNKPVVPPKKEVWMSCRATPGCEGKKAFISLMQKRAFLQGGGTFYRYRCLTCNGVWHVTV